MHIYIKKYLISSVVMEKLLWPQNRVIFVDFDPDRLYLNLFIIFESFCPKSVVFQSFPPIINR